jgi:hypothetical protein
MPRAETARSTTNTVARPHVAAGTETIASLPLIDPESAMNDHAEELVRRVEQLERKNRRLVRWGALTVVATFGGGLMSMRAVCDTISAERFVLVDGQGKQRAVLTAYETGGAPKLTFLDPKGRAVATLATDEGGAYLALSDAKGENSVRFAACEGGPGESSGPAKPAKKGDERTGLGATVFDAGE